MHAGEEESDSGYFSDGELSSAEAMEVTDEYFFEHLFDNDDEDVVPPPQDIGVPIRPTPVQGLRNQGRGSCTYS